MAKSKLNPQKKFTPLLAIGDPHGSYDRLMEIINANSTISRYIFTGDYMDRGKQSIQTIEKILSLVKNGQAVALVGNHDMFFISSMLGDKAAFRDWLGNGGTKVLQEIGFGSSSDSYNGFDQLTIMNNAKLKEIAHQMRNHLKLFHIENRTLFVHAGLPFFKGSFQPYKGETGLKSLEIMQEDFKNGILSYNSIYKVEFDEEHGGWIAFGTSVIWSERDWLDHLVSEEEVTKTFQNKSKDISKERLMFDYELTDLKKQLTKYKLTQILKEFDVDRIVHSHDPYVHTRTFFDNRIINIDCGMADVYGGYGGALIFEKNQIKSYNHKQKTLKILIENL